MKNLIVLTLLAIGLFVGGCAGPIKADPRNGIYEQGTQFLIDKRFTRLEAEYVETDGSSSSLTVVGYQSETAQVVDAVLGRLLGQYTLVKKEDKKEVVE